MTNALRCTTEYNDPDRHSTDGATSCDICVFGAFMGEKGKCERCDQNEVTCEAGTTTETLIVNEGELGRC